MRLIIIVIIFLFSIHLPGQNRVDKLVNRIDAILEDDFFISSQVAINVFDLTTNESLYDINSQLLFHPASNQKLFTTAAALLFLPDDFRFTTSVYYSGKIKGVTLYGDLYVVGGLDPSFTSDDLDSLVNDIESLGIRYITGNLYADLSIKDSLYWGKGWMWDDDPDPTAPYLSALNINDNVIEVFVEAGNNDTIPKVTLIPETGFATVENHSTTSDSSPTDLDITRNWVERKNHIIIKGTIKRGGIIDSSNHEENLNLLNPEFYFLTLLKEKFEKKSIIIYGDVDIKKVPESSSLISTYEHSVDSLLLGEINKKSDNLKSEMLLYALALNDSGAPAIAKNGIESLYKLLDTIGLNRDDYKFADGSGVSRYNLITTQAIIELLKFMYAKEKFDIYYNWVAIAGVDGTLEKRMLNSLSENNVHAKTGTLAGVSALSGYVTSKNNHFLAFSILMQNFVDKPSIARRLQDQICNILAGYE